MKGLIAAHACLKIEFTEGDKCHNLMSWLIYALSETINCFLSVYCFMVVGKKFHVWSDSFAYSLFS